MSSAAAEPNARSPIARIAANTAWLLGGKAFGAVCSLVYLAILTRSLGLKDFGHFALILGTGQALIGIAGFQSWRSVVRYGATHLHAGDWRNFGRLAMFCGMLDALGAVLGCALAAIAIYGLGDLLEINPAYRDAAFLFSCALVLAPLSAPTGIVRALRRFDMAAYVEAIVPTGRLIAAVTIWLTGPSLTRFLLAWAAIDVLQGCLYWAMARYLCPQAVRLRYLREWRQALRANPGIRPFIAITSATGTLDAAIRHGPLLAVGAVVGTRAAGVYRLANQLAQAMSKLSVLLTRTVYTEIAHVRVARTAAEFRRLAEQTSLIAAGAGVLVVVAAVLFGDELLVLVAGKAFGQGHAILVPLAVAASCELASVAFEPVLHATGFARYVLPARLTALAALIAAAAVLAPVHGSLGMAWAVTFGSAISYAAMGMLAWRSLGRLDSASPQADGEPLAEPQREP